MEMQVYAETRGTQQAHAIHGQNTANTIGTPRCTQDPCMYIVVNVGTKINRFEAIFPGFLVATTQYQFLFDPKLWESWDMSIQYRLGGTGLPVFEGYNECTVDKIRSTEPIRIVTGNLVLGTYAVNNTPLINGVLLHFVSTTQHR